MGSRFYSRFTSKSPLKVQDDTQKKGLCMDRTAQAINEANKKFMDALKRGDYDKLASLYSAEAALMPPGTTMITGREAIARFWKTAMDMGVKQAKLETVKVEEGGDLAHELGKFVLTIRQQDGADIEARGKYVVVWKRQDSHWQLHADIWNADS